MPPAQPEHITDFKYSWWSRLYWVSVLLEAETNGQKENQENGFIFICSWTINASIKIYGNALDDTKYVGLIHQWNGKNISNRAENKKYTQETTSKAERERERKEIHETSVCLSHFSKMPHLWHIRLLLPVIFIKHFRIKTNTGLPDRASSLCAWCMLSVRVSPFPLNYGGRLQCHNRFAHEFLSHTFAVDWT